MKLLGGTNLSPEETKSKTRVSIIESVQTPLGFFTLAILVLEAILLGESLTTGRIEPWMPILLIAVVIVLVFVLVLVKPSAVGVSQKTEITVTMMFPKGHSNVNFDFECGELSIKPKGKTRTTEKFTPTAKYEGGWYHTLPPHVTPEDQLFISLKDTTGNTWKTKPFIPRAIAQELELDPAHVPADGGG